MRIAINGRVLIENQLEGLGYFTKEVLRHLVEIYPQHEYLVLFDRPPADQFLFPGVEYRVLRPAARHPLLYHVWFEALVPWHLRNWDAEIFLSFDGFTSRHLKIPVVTAIHDLAYAHYPEAIKRRELSFYKRYQPLFASVSAAVLTVSEFSRKDIHEKLSVPLDRIFTVYNGSRFEKTPPEADECFLRKHDLEPEQYFIYTGSLHPRKNIVCLITAFEYFSEQVSQEFKLVLAGRNAWKVRHINEAVERSAFKDRIVRTGYIPDKELWTLINEAAGLCYISLFEGFGVPVLDALHAGTPVIGSRTTSIPEVVGDAGLLVDPGDPQSVATAMVELVKNHALRAKLKKEGQEQRLKFSWTSTTRKIYDVITKVYEEHYDSV